MSVTSPEFQDQFVPIKNDKSDMQTLVQIPTDYTRSSIRSSIQNKLSLPVNSNLTDKLNVLCSKENTDLKVILLSAFGVLLYRYSSQDDFTIGSLVHQVPVRFEFPEKESFSGMVGSVREKLNGIAGLSTTFNVYFDFQSSQLNDKGRIVLNPLTDLILFVSDKNDTLECFFTYSTDLFAEETISRMAGHYLTILNTISENPKLDVLEIPLLTSAETKEILEDWNNTKVEYPADKCIHSLFEEQAAKTPESIAVVYENESLSYSALNSRANQLASYLVKQGAGEGRCVALCVERSLDLIIGLLAITKSGAPYIPLDPIYPKERLALILNDASPVLILTQSSLTDKLPPTSGKLIFIDDKSVFENESLRNPGPGNSKNPAYILYTSGSTGKPKGVQITQQAVVNLISSMSKSFAVMPSDILYAVTTIAFDIAQMDMFLPLFNGAKLVIGTADTATDMELLIQQIEESGATLFQATPVTYKMLVIHSWKGKSDLRVLAGGEAFSKELVRELLPRCREVWNGYGPTETAIYSVVKKLTPADAEGEGYVQIGKPIDNTYVYVLNSKLIPVPVGIPGELYIGGVGVSPGYLNLPEMTNERFIANPFSDQTNLKIYRTGDIVQYFNDGNMVFLNRMDSQVKIRGFRIELGEIESAISQFKSIRDNVVIAREDNPGDKRLAAYIIPQENTEPDLSDLRQFLKAKLPDYMIPSAFVKMESFPLTPNGKVNRKALPVPEVIHSLLTTHYIAPRNEKEQQLSAIWSRVLKIEKIGVLDNFFELGGNSLVATMLISRINNLFKIRLPLRVLFEKQTISEIGMEIEKFKRPGTVVELAQTIPHIQSASNDFPLSPGQKRLWFVENFEPGNRAYNMPFDYRIDGVVDPLILEKSIEELLKRHESLRTIIPTVDGNPVQVIREITPYPLEIIYLDHLSREEKVEAIEGYSYENEMHLFDLEKGPLFIGKLLKISSSEWMLLINTHHIINDGWSVGTLIDELGIIYTALKDKKPVCLPPHSITYTDFATWQNEWLKGDECKKQLNFWVNELTGAPELLQLPMDFQRPQHQTYDGDEVSFILDKKITEQLRQFSQDNNVSLFMTLLSVFNSLISRYTSQEDFVIGIPIAGRVLKELESLVGLLINNFPLRITTRENMSFLEMFEMTKKKFFHAYDNQELPVDLVVQELKLTRYANISPLFQVMFNLLNMFDQEICLGDSKMKMVDKRRHIAQFDLSMHIYESTNNMNCVLEFNTNLFKRERIERMAGHFIAFVNAILKDPGQKLRKIPMLAESEKKLILGDWNSTSAEYETEKCLHTLIEERVVQSRDSIAITDDNLQITYAELNAKANRLAHHLHDSGAIEGSLIGICLERSSNLVVALLAVLKAGCTYIPLDPIYPKNRLALILEDSNPVIMLTEKNLLESLPESNAKYIFLADEEAYRDKPVHNPVYSVSPETVAYLIYTSGSTGKPKGVQIQHRALVNFMSSMRKRPGITSKDVLLALTTISFDIAGLELYLPLLNGAEIVITKHETSVNPELLIHKIGECKPTIIQATPVTFRMLNSSGWSGLPNLKILCGGEAMPKDLANDLLRKCGELWNMYGPTETTIWSTTEKVELNESDTSGYVNLGKPIDNTLVYVLNPELQLVPVGYPGELFIGGDSLAKGYYHLPEMTKEKFLPDPFSDKVGARMYRTGDLVQQTEEGKLEFLNRVDSQVKIRGFRIELGEIESALSLYKTVKDNVVVVREDTPGDKKLIAYIIRKDNQDTDIPEVRQFLKTKLPDYMVPSSFIFIDKFPLTPNGKIDRKALPSPKELAPQEAKSYMEPKTDIEKKLHQIWCEVLKLDRIGIDENFFDIGGHSMIAVTLMVKIENELDIRLPLATLFEQSNIREMAALIENRTAPVQWGSLVPIKPHGKKRPLYLVHGAGLNLLLYTALVSHLDPEQPVFGLQAKGLDGVDEPLDTIEGIAAYYISEILAVDVSGTYALAGFSMGGQIAYEMARQMVEMGKTVSFLGVFDTVSYNASDKHLPIVERYLYRTDRFYHQVAWTIGTFFKMPGKEKFKFVAAKWKSMKQKITKNDYTIKPEGVSLGKKSELPKYLHKVHQANYRALENYILPTYTGKLHLFRAMDQKFYIKDPIAYGWNKFVKGGVVIHDIPGEHSRIFAPPYDIIFAERLQACLNNCT
jgi:amino acid adenylation domain-containing protein